VSEAPTVTELEFVFDGSEFDLGRAGAAGGADVDVKLVVPRSDGTVLAFVDVSSDVAAVLEALRAEPTVHEATLLERPDGRPLVQVTMAGHPVTTLADRGAVVTQVAATDRWGRVVADVPPPVDVGPVIAAFTLAHPPARLVGRRETDRQVPLLGQSQFVTRVLSQFTERQLNALRVAYDHGYFEWPRDTKAADVAAELGISTPTFSQHIRAAERKLTKLLFEG
jgi:hypothetical protein